jgi:predicted glycosyltransferase
MSGNVMTPNLNGHKLKEPNKQPRVALYSHDTMGIGHMRRNILIAQTLAAPPISATVLLIAGAREASEFKLSPNVDCLTLPALRKTSEGRYESRSLGLSLTDLIELRSQTIAAAVRSFEPDVLIVDKEPRGAAGELQPTLDRLQARGQTRCVLGLRDVLDDPATVRKEWRAARNEAAIRGFYDAVWVYGDASVYDLAREYDLSPEVRDKLLYAGYLDPCQRLNLLGSGIDDRSGDAGPLRRPYALCMVGGGQDGAELAEAFAAAELPRGLSGVVLTGPYMPNAARRVLNQLAAGNPRLQVLDFVTEPCRLMCQADRVVAMGGYNTVSEILAFERRALVVPRVAPRREQLIRAQRMNDLGLIDILHPDQLSPSAVAHWLAREPATIPSARKRIDLNGTMKLPGLLQSLLAEPARARSLTRTTPYSEVGHVAS